MCKISTAINYLFCHYDYAFNTAVFDRPVFNLDYQKASHQKQQATTQPGKSKQ